jgi:hypothetical protein
MFPSAVGSGTLGSSPVISGIFVAEEADGAGYKGSGDTTTVICTDTLGSFFKKRPQDLLVSLLKLFFFSATTLLKC